MIYELKDFQNEMVLLKVSNITKIRIKVWTNDKDVRSIDFMFDTTDDDYSNHYTFSLKGYGFMNETFLLNSAFTILKEKIKIQELSFINLGSLFEHFFNKLDEK